MKVVLDTNVLVSALINPQGTPAKILNLVLNEELTLIVDSRIFSEYNTVLRRPKFSFDSANINCLLEFIRHTAVFVTPTSANLTLKDKSDEAFLEVAIFSKASCLITGNTKHFPKGKVKKVRICSPNDFFE